jgi:myosin protein heavy chain
LESRIEELTSQLSQTSRDKSETVRLQRTADKTARDAKTQLIESERQRSKLEEEVRNYDAKIHDMRADLDALVSGVNDMYVLKLGLTLLPYSKRRRLSYGGPRGRLNGRLRITSRKL